MDYSTELIRLNKDEEFEYFNLNRAGKNLGKFTAWNIDEHTLFRQALESAADPTNVALIAASIQTRSVDQVDVHLKVYQNHCNKQVSQQSNPFLSNLTNSLFKGVIDSLGKDPVSPLSGGGSTPTQFLTVPSPSTSSSPSLGPTSSSSPGASNPSSPASSSGKISLHLASHAIPTALQPTASKNVVVTDATTTPAHATGTQSSQVETKHLINNSAPKPKSKKDQKILSEPWSAEDQKRLEEALTKYPSSRYSSVSRWQAISKELGIPPKTVALRYNQMLDNLTGRKEAAPVEDEQEDSTQTKGKRKAAAGRTTAKQPAATKKGKKDTTSTTSDKGLPPLPLPQPMAKQASSTTIQQPPPPPAKREPTIHHLNFNPEKADQLIQRNSALIDQIRSDIMYTGSTKVDHLEQYKNNITEALKCTMIWSPDSNEMPPLPVKVNDMIITMKTNMKQWNPLPKVAAEWSLSVEEATGGLIHQDHSSPSTSSPSIDTL
ncbi:hypothetical protein SAMD00019534_070490 [Acytostelium subglobosum LB1]|uniref:hypothetical protein n=1 Tax=Acytostelium subglobosum LB1 TaxID=1410327 RepID=UPI0006449FD6|nr:hypothetical protein SAMD00019534_070490 [Acytostelium subglobosum LB1]GAM23874.1 hypothetical protein SAMD00019534_070490 [Acytostelium subglobosum LB1]|eukprot:XP_012752910.1 hypothetical protein SAMD00019534_070490 [Acytostelium subglobosum LB1]